MTTKGNKRSLFERLGARFPVFKHELITYIDKVTMLNKDFSPYVVCEFCDHEYDFEDYDECPDCDENEFPDWEPPEHPDYAGSEE